jgi:membrane protein
VTPGAQLIAAIADYAVGYILISGYLALMIAFPPSKKVGQIAPVAAGFIAGAIFVAGKYAITIYFARAQPASAFGAASAMVVVVLRTYYLALGLLLSAVLARGVLYAIPSSEAAPARASSVPRSHP